MHYLPLFSWALFHSQELKQKVIVFFISRQVVEFHYHLFTETLDEGSDSLYLVSLGNKVYMYKQYCMLVCIRTQQCLCAVMCSDGAVSSGVLFKSGTVATALFVSPVTDMSLFELHGSMRQDWRRETYQKFCAATSGALLCTVSYVAYKSY